MTKEQKLLFVKELTQTIVTSVLEKIESDVVPEAWDGIELRQYLADKFSASSYTMTSTRLREYRNEFITNFML